MRDKILKGGLRDEKSNRWIPDIIDEIWEKIQDGYSIGIINEKGDVLYESGLFKSKYAGTEFEQTDRPVTKHISDR